MNYGLPKSVNIGGTEYDIRYDFRVILEIFEAINDCDLNDEERAIAALQMFYVDYDRLPDYNEALLAMFKFMNGGKEEDTTTKKQPQLVYWEKDFPYIIAPVNRVLGSDLRNVTYDIETNSGGVHWWTFLSAYMEIGGDCLFAQIVGIRSKKAKGQKLDKSDREFYKRNRDIIDVKTQYTSKENDIMKKWL